MFVTSKTKWFGSIILAGTLLVMALMGGQWGTDSSAIAAVNVAPYIASIRPSAVLAGSADTQVLIIGSNFGALIDNIKVRLTGNSIVQLLTPVTVGPNLIIVNIPADLLAEPQVYILEVIKYSGGTIPDEEISNPVRFTVYGPFIYLPIVTKDALR